MVCYFTCRAALPAVVGLAVFGVLARCQEVKVPAETVQVELNGHTFTLPAGFTVELIAGPPLVDRPITASFDERGNLYVADSSGSNEKVQEQLEKKPHRIVRLEDTDGDGQYDHSTVFADRLMFPEGTLWLDGSLYVAATPSIWKLTDTDGDGVADQREEWFEGKTMTGCANDLHGPYAGPDGWIYWCKGAFARQTYERVGKSLRVIPGAKPDESPPGMQTWSTRASHIFRCRPDGSGLETVMTGGMDNPVDTVFTPGGERIFTTTFLVHPGAGLRDGLIHAVYGGIYGKDQEVIHEPVHPWTGPETMPVLVHQGAAAPCGLTAYESAAFGDEYRDNLFACLFNMHKVTRHVLTTRGATFQSRNEDFLVSSNLDFHPTDILEDADGSLVVVDTGGWYKLCCPTSQLHKPDILGAIYRVRRDTHPRQADPWGVRIAWAKQSPSELLGLLGDARPAVRGRAVRELAGRGDDVVIGLDGSAGAKSSEQVRRNLVWALTRLESQAARAAVRRFVTDSSQTVRQVALHSISLHRDAAAVRDLLELLQSGTPRDQRAAAEALGRIGDRSAVAPLLAVAGRRPSGDADADRVLEHALLYALIEIGDRAATQPGLASDNPRTRKAALVALSEMNQGGLEPQTVAPLLASTEPTLREAAAWVTLRHPEWGEAMAGVLRERLLSDHLSDEDRSELARQLARFARHRAIQQLLAETLLEESSGRAQQLVVLEAIRGAGLREKEVPGAWITSLAKALDSRDADILRSAVAAVRALPVPKESAKELGEALLKLGKRSDLPDAIRVDALAVAPGGLDAVEAELFEFLRDRLHPEGPVTTRSAAADVIARAKLSTAQLALLTQSFTVVSPLEVDRLLAPFGQCSDESVGLQLVSALKESGALTALRPDTLKTHLAKFGPMVQQQAQPLFAALNVDLAKQQERLEELLASLSSQEIKTPDIRRGQAVFMGQKAACFSCHQHGYLGGKIGPDLTRIGGIRTERDLVEAIAFPNASFVRSYEPFAVATTDGRVFSGILRKDSPEEIVLTINATDEARIPREDIEEMRPSTVSVMPSGLEQQLSRQELADLIAFLKASK